MRRKGVRAAMATSLMLALSVPTAQVVARHAPPPRPPAAPIASPPAASNGASSLPPATRRVDPVVLANSSLSIALSPSTDMPEEFAKRLLGE